METPILVNVLKERNKKTKQRFQSTTQSINRSFCFTIQPNPHPQQRGVALKGVEGINPLVNPLVNPLHKAHPQNHPIHHFVAQENFFSPTITGLVHISGVSKKFIKPQGNCNKKIIKIFNRFNLIF